jgi:DNA-binding transcriptional LysR family regulator
MKPPQINVQQLISFYFVAKEKSFSSASEKLFITQPAVTQQIKALEGQFAVKLINVKKKRVYLTKAGERLLNYAETIVNHASMAENFLKSYRINSLRIGVATTITVYLTPIIDKFKEMFPSVTMSVREGTSMDLVKDLIDFKYDVCLTGTLPEVDKKLHIMRMPEMEKLVLVASPDFPLYHEPPMKWENLVNYPLILQCEGSTGREAILRHFASRNLTPTIGTEVDNVEFGKRLALQSKGLALMFHPYVAEEVAQGKLAIIPVADKEIRLGIDVVTNQEAPTPPLLRAFLDVIENHFGYPLDYPGDDHETAPSSLRNLFST